MLRARFGGRRLSFRPRLMGQVLDIGVITVIGQNGVRTNIRKKHIGPVQMTGLATGQMEAYRVAPCINSCVALGIQPASALSDCFVPIFFRAPALS